ncbi:bifunctional proline dehydrogenase/L-glutamate gamma-semialdehyde dehydrogenase PutA [Gluconobacter morbifer]|uniref:Bifunctional protein PutA n=1 Tax=Gluconobacter morbifer G707 TaxID=1088869 RepID=G6XJW7_9PROT|nr:bifunctional proline dehydrogenase/L-glutamate gamma-semialdehyde dehydrogenase PutA [Gluconobacter morbifer]EHH67929.1 Delta 1-pyrroline-5-carboxylate dehydrogenase [Gluconobacter morbifer G707]
MPHSSPSPRPRPLRAFSRLLQSRAPRSARRDAISAAHYRPEAECIEALLPKAQLTPEQDRQASELARTLAQSLRRMPAGSVESLLHSFPIASPEGTALLTLMEAFLRVPDTPTRDALIRDQIGQTDWSRYTGWQRSPLVNTMARSMTLAAKLRQAKGFSLRRLTLQTSAPMIRRGLDKALHQAGNEFILGSDIGVALKASQPREKDGFTFCYEMEVCTALMADQAAQALTTYEEALEALGRHAGVTGTLYERPSLSIRLPALHPRFGRARRERVMAELFPVLHRLIGRARQLDIGVVLSCEDSTHLELTLDLFEALCGQPEVEGWNGLGLTLQAYDRRTPAILDFLIDLGRRTARRIIVRLVKGACWDSEIRRAQHEGLPDFPVYTRRCHTDLAYLVCARTLLGALDAVYPRFATHNPRTIGHLQALAGQQEAGSYEFECLNGTNIIPLLRQQGLNVPCRLHAPVGPHDRLLPCFVRHLLENGATSLILNRDADPAATIEALTLDPVEAVRAIRPTERASRAIRAPADLFAPGRRNASGYDLSDEACLRALQNALKDEIPFLEAGPLTPDAPSSPRLPRTLCNPADRNDVLGNVVETDGPTLLAALDTAGRGQPGWAARSREERVRILQAAADRLEADIFTLMALLVREAGKTFPAALDDVRRAVDFIRYDAESLQDQDLSGMPLGLVACISPWCSPLAAFVQQVTVALAAGNAVLAKPAEETPFIAFHVVQHLLAAGIPADVLHFLPGNGSVGEQLVADPRIDAVMFTGSTPVAKALSRQVFDRRSRTGLRMPLIARAGGQNAMLVDSSVQPEQVVQDILTSAFDCAGQHCSSLRILLLQEDCADEVLSLLRGAIQELSLGNPVHLSTEMGPIISPEAQTEVEDHINMMRRAGRPVWSPELGENCLFGNFLAPTLIEIGRVADIPQEVFGPVLHIRRFARSEMDGVIDAVNSMGYRLTFSVQSRLTSTIDRITHRIQAANIFVNRPMTGAVAGSQPFGGNGMSGNGPKAGGPLALRRMVAKAGNWRLPEDGQPGKIPGRARGLVAFLESRDAVSARRIRQDISHELTGAVLNLPGPSGEINTLTLAPRGAILCAGESWPAILRAVGMALGTGNTALVLGPDHALEWMQRLPQGLADGIQRVDPGALPECAALLMEPTSALARQAASTLTNREGAIVPIYCLNDVRPEWLLEERVMTVNTAALCGDPTLMTLA